ncbi:hypothetical protein L3476_08050 [Paenibacillus thiaminolyticus]|uniref:hypothetical protein n=1 Tax=Paenibacillus thiaminolyticus TaxID=49283 RepID=UPI00235049E0|nr:hypothetical protein [Paenibacillus thiaminolyticus]WCR28671.1 hypothetical protein L3476_08050 [Paenibacillus thiaminolyticus]
MAIIRTQLNRKLKKNYNKKRYYRIMHALGLKAVIRKKRPNYVKASEIHVAENVMNREFQADSPNSKWCMDVAALGLDSFPCITGKVLHELQYDRAAILYIFYSGFFLVALIVITMIFGI